MIEVDFGDRVEATCRFDYSGPAGNFTFAQEIGTWIPPVFNTLDRWEVKNILITPGTGQERKMTFTINEVGGLNPGDTYDMNFEIGKGSQDDDTWEFLTRKITDDIIKIAEVLPEFDNLSVTYRKL